MDNYEGWWVGYGFGSGYDFGATWGGDWGDVWASSYGSILHGGTCSGRPSQPRGGGGSSGVPERYKARRRL